jgi:hypothetical protein
MDVKVLERSLEAARQLGVQVIGIAGGEPFEYPQVQEYFTEIDHGLWKRVRVATNGDRLLRDPDLLKWFGTLISFEAQVTMHDDKTKDSWRKVFDGDVPDNVFVRDRPVSFFPSSKAVSSQSKRSLADTMYCRRLRSVASHQKLERRDIGDLLMHSMRDKYDPCTFHIHPDGVVRAGPWDRCQVLGTVEDLYHAKLEWRRKTIRKLAGGYCHGCLRNKEIVKQTQEGCESGSL